MPDSDANVDALDTLFADLKSRGLATEADYDRATDALASGATTETELIAEWQGRVTGAAEDATANDDDKDLLKLDIQVFLTEKIPPEDASARATLRMLISKIQACLEASRNGLATGHDTTTCLLSKCKAMYFLAKRTEYAALRATTNVRDMSEPIANYEAVLAITRELAAANSGMDQQDVAIALNNLGVCHKHAGDFAKAVHAYEEAFQLCPWMPKLRGNLDRCREKLLQMRFNDSMCQQSPATASAEALTAIALSQAQMARILEVQKCESAWPPMGMPLPIPSNSPGGAIQGGLARVRELSRKQELNGVEGRLTHYAMEKGRFAFQPLSGAPISVRPHNLEPVDRYPDPLCNVNSTAFCDKLQKSLTAAGDHRCVIDLTPHVMGFKSMLSAFVWVINRHDFLFGASNSSHFSKCLFYVQRSNATDPFFLFVRELTMSANRGAPAPPFIVVREEGEGLIVPPTGGHHLDMEPMLRFCLMTLTPTWKCPVCLENFKNSPNIPHEVSQAFDCGHLICQLCLGRLFPVGSLGLTCPVCRSFSASLGTKTPDFKCENGAAQIYEKLAV